MSLELIQRPSPNHGSRPAPAKIRCLVLHADASANAQGTLNWLANPTSGVSYHYLIDRNGDLYQCVQDDRRAWHAGKSEWGGVTDVNDFSIGVSFSNDQKLECFTPAALEAGAQLCADLCKRHSLTPTDAVLTTHAIIARPVGRKTDPSKLFPLLLFRTQVRALVEALP